MVATVVMPQMGYDMTEGTVARWLKREGEEVRRGEPIAEIETDKAVVEMEADTPGVLLKIVVPEGVKVPVGTAIGHIGAPGETVPETAGPPRPAAAAPSEAAAEAPLEVRASPVARKLAEEKGIDLKLVTGTGPGGRITREDVLAFEAQPQRAAPPSVEAPPAAPPSPPGAPKTIALSRMRQAIARTTQQSKQQAPHFYVSTEVDMTRAMELRAELNQSLGERGHVSVNDLIVKACALALAKYPKFNSFFKGDHLQVSEAINIGIAVAMEQGLMVPAIMHCQAKSLVQLAADARDLAARAQQGRLRQDEYTAGTFSISNLGMYDVDSFAAIIFPPQSAVLAVGTVRKRPVVRDEQVVVRQMMTATLSVDHRVADGAEAAQFLTEVKRVLERPLLLLA